MLTMLERMRLTCSALPQGKALNVPCIIVYEMYQLPSIQLTLIDVKDILLCHTRSAILGSCDKKFSRSATTWR